MDKTYKQKQYEKLDDMKKINPDYEVCPYCGEFIIVSHYFHFNDFQCSECFKWIKP